MGNNPQFISGDQYNLHTSATLTYADANEHALEASPSTNELYRNIVVEFKVTSLANTTAQTLTFGVATSNYELTGAVAFAELTSAYWSTNVITLNAGADVFYYKISIPAENIIGKFIYTKYEYGADPTGDPTIEAKLNLI